MSRRLRLLLPLQHKKRKIPDVLVSHIRPGCIFFKLGYTALQLKTWLFSSISFETAGAQIADLTAAAASCWMRFTDCGSLHPSMPLKGHQKRVGRKSYEGKDENKGKS